MRCGDTETGDQTKGPRKGTTRAMLKRRVTGAAKKPDDGKLKELILYVAARCQEDPAFGAVKLNKILFFADFIHYAHVGKAITGTEYRKYPYGPAPARMKAVKRQLENEQAAYEYANPLPHSTFHQKRLLARRAPDLGAFSPAEITTVERVIEMLRGKNATEVSQLSHELPCWSLARDQETIPYFTALIPNTPPDLTEEEIGWLATAAKRASSGTSSTPTRGTASTSTRVATK
jgi:hypothetical protein